MIITFCGHSDYIRRTEDERRVLTFFESTVGAQNVEFFLGGYGGFDSFAYVCAKKYKLSHKNAMLMYVTPYLDRIVDKIYDDIIYPPIENVPFRFAISHRNKWMAEQADIVICYVIREYGGAYQTYVHAKRKGKTIFNLADFE